MFELGFCMAQFLDSVWFDEVAKLNHEAGDLALPSTLANIVVNVDIQGDSPRHLHLKKGKIWQGLADDAISTIITDSDTLATLIAGKNTDAALEAFMTGKIRIEGDMSALISLQSIKPSPEQKQLYKAILAQTDFN